MKLRILTDVNIAEFEQLGRDYDVVEGKIKAILAKRAEERTDEDYTEIYTLTSEQVAIHSKRMKLLD